MKFKLQRSWDEKIEIYDNLSIADKYGGKHCEHIYNLVFLASILFERDMITEQQVIDMFECYVDDYLTIVGVIKG